MFILTFYLRESIIILLIVFALFIIIIWVPFSTGIQFLIYLNEKIASAVVKLEEFDYSGAMADAEEALNIEPDNEEAFVIKQKAKQSLNER